MAKNRRNKKKNGKKAHRSGVPRTNLNKRNGNTITLAQGTIGEVGEVSDASFDSVPLERLPSAFNEESSDAEIASSSCESSTPDDVRVLVSRISCWVEVARL